MKKILIFSLAYYPNPTSGAEAAIKEITDRIDPTDIEFHLVTLRYNSALPKEEKIGNVHIYRIGITKNNPAREDLGKLPLDLNKPLFQFLAAWTALRLHRIHRFDAIWSMMAHSAGIPAAIFKLVHRNIPYVLTLQEGDPPERIEHMMRPVWPLFSRAFTSATIVQAISTFLADWARRMKYTGPIELIHNGANPNDVAESADPAAVAALQQKLGKKPGDIYLTNTARLVHQKGHDTVIRALPQLPEHVSFLLVGDGPDEAMLKQLAQELHVNHRVIFTGAVPRSEVTLYRKASDIFVGPSRSEGLGNAFLSAMASRLPVIATQVGGIAEFLFDAKRNPDKPTTGWAVDPDVPEHIRAAVMDIIEHPETVQTVTDTARAMILRSYQWDAVAKDMRTRVFGTCL